MFGDFPAKNTVCKPYIYGSGQPCTQPIRLTLPRAFAGKDVVLTATARLHVTCSHLPDVHNTFILLCPERLQARTLCQPSQHTCTSRAPTCLTYTTHPLCFAQGVAGKVVVLTATACLHVTCSHLTDLHDTFILLCPGRCRQGRCANRHSTLARHVLPPA